MAKLMSIFELTENLSLVLTKLDYELGLAQPQLVFCCFCLLTPFLENSAVFIHVTLKPVPLSKIQRGKLRQCKAMSAKKRVPEMRMHVKLTL